MQLIISSALVSTRCRILCAGLNVRIRKGRTAVAGIFPNGLNNELSLCYESSIKLYHGAGYKSCPSAYSLIIKKCWQPMVIYAVLKSTNVLN